MKQQYPQVISGLFILNKQGQLLLIKTHKWHGKYCVPGGKVELGETIFTAGKREAREELGITIHGLKFLCFYEFIFEKDFYKKKHFVFFDLKAKTNATKIKLNEEAQGYLWLKPKETLKLPLEKYTKKTIIKYLI